MTDDVSITQADIRAALDHLGWEDYDDFCAWALSNEEMGRFDDLTVAFARHRETGTRAVPNGQSPNPIPSSDLDALVERLENTAAVSESDAELIEAATAITSLRNQLTASEARERELRRALEPLAVLQIPERPQGIAGLYSIRHADIARARSLTNTENHHGS